MYCIVFWGRKCLKYVVSWTVVLLQNTHISFSTFRKYFHGDNRRLVTIKVYFNLFYSWEHGRLSPSSAKSKREGTTMEAFQARKNPVMGLIKQMCHLKYTGSPVKFCSSSLRSFQLQHACLHPLDYTCEEQRSSIYFILWFCTLTLLAFFHNTRQNTQNLID